LGPSAFSRTADRADVFSEDGVRLAGWDHGKEAAYLAALPAAVRYRVEEHSLELLNADGTPVA
jgi:hypothetical protein